MEYVKALLSERLGLDTRVTTLGHTQRGGRPCAYDRILVSILNGRYDILLTIANQGTLQGVDAVDCLLEATPQTPSYMIGICENKITKIPLVQAVKQVDYLSPC